MSIKYKNTYTFVHVCLQNIQIVDPQIMYVYMYAFQIILELLINYNYR